MKIVVGGTYKDFKRWQYELRLSQKEAVYVGEDRERAQGLLLKEEDIVRLGPVSPEMELLLKTRIR